MIIYDLIILGGGPAGVAAGVYAARKRIKTLLLAESIGGQSTDSINIQNWIGIISMTGIELAERLEKHLRAYADNVLEIKTMVRVNKVNQLKKDKEEGLLFEVETDDKQKYYSRLIIYTLGSRRRKLQAKRADDFEHKGIVYCASCDAPLFRDKEVAVVGGGNAGFETAEQLISYAKKIFLFEIGSIFKADKLTQERVLKNDKVKAYTNAEVLEVKGDKMVSGLVWKDRTTNNIQDLPVQGIFVEIGSIPNTEPVKDIVKLNKYNEIVINHKSCRTSVNGIWAAGDVTDQPYKQNNISMGDAVKALEDAYLYLQKIKGR